MPNYNKLFSLDPETIEIVESLPKTKRSEFVRDGIKTLNQMKLNGESPGKVAKSLENVGIEL